jgi:serine/threonine protein kinase
MHSFLKRSHGDIKSDNFVFRDDFTLALIDLAASKQIIEWTQDPTGTEGYSSPDVMKRATRPYSVERADMYALGVTLYTIIFLEMPL